MTLDGSFVLLLLMMMLWLSVSLSLSSLFSNDYDNCPFSSSAFQAASLGRERKPPRHNLLPGPQLLHDLPSPVKSRKTSIDIDIHSHLLY